MDLCTRLQNDRDKHDGVRVNGWSGLYVAIFADASVLSCCIDAFHLLNAPTLLCLDAAMCRAMPFADLICMEDIYRPVPYIGAVLFLASYFPLPFVAPASFCDHDTCWLRCIVFILRVVCILERLPLLAS
eukprot:SAG31_NODE_2144_length_6341_cov_59.535085_4_plen_130_part_00